LEEEGKLAKKEFEKKGHNIAVLIFELLSSLQQFIDPMAHFEISSGQDRLG
jgi:hypothetical protein